MGTNTNETQYTPIHWLRDMLADERRRAILQTLIAQYDLPVIQIGRTKSQQLRKGRTTPRNFPPVNSARPK